jgi:putative ABC transport system permease protein
VRGFGARWLVRSLRGNLGASAVATGSLGLAAALVFAVVAVSAGVEAQLGADLRAYGANVLVLPRQATLRLGLGALELGAVQEERTLAAADLAAPPAGLVDALAAGLVLRARAGGREVGAVGYDLAALRRLNPLWRVAPRWPEAADEVMVGSSLAASLGLAAGRELELEVGGRRARVRVAAVLETGAGDDEALLLPLPLSQALAGRPGRVSFALVRARLEGRSPEEVARALEAAIPGAEARTLRQVAHAEAALLAKVRRLLLLVTAAVSAAAAFTVAGTAAVVLLARRQEIGLCLAMGGTPGALRRLFLAEAAVGGLAGGAAGCLLGAAAAEAIAWSVFGGPVPLAAGAAPLALSVALLVSLGASAWPVLRAVRCAPRDLLRAP